MHVFCFPYIYIIYIYRRLEAELNWEVVSCRACVRAHGTLVCMSSEFRVEICGLHLSLSLSLSFSLNTCLCWYIVGAPGCNSKRNTNSPPKRMAARAPINRAKDWTHIIIIAGHFTINRSSTAGIHTLHSTRSPTVQVGCRHQHVALNTDGIDTVEV